MKKKGLACSRASVVMKTVPCSEKRLFCVTAATHSLTDVTSADPSRHSPLIRCYG